MGRPCDLRSAYKQFGAIETVGSVSPFLRISMTLWFIGTVSIELCWTAFYDDCTNICKKRMSHETSIAALEAIEKSKRIEPQQAGRLRGRMQWFEGYTFGRIAQHGLKVLSELSLRHKEWSP